jgi:hypothetical protein
VLAQPVHDELNPCFEPRRTACATQKSPSFRQSAPHGNSALVSLAALLGRHAAHEWASNSQLPQAAKAPIRLAAPADPKQGETDDAP